MALLLWMLLLWKCAHCQVCLWGRTGTKTNSYLNGEFKYNEYTFNDQPAYGKNEYGKKITLLYYNPNWRIISNNANHEILAQCVTNNTNISSGCSGFKWQIGENMTIDPQVTATYGTCPGNFLLIIHNCTYLNSHTITNHLHFAQK